MGKLWDVIERIGLNTIGFDALVPQPILKHKLFTTIQDMVAVTDDEPSAKTKDDKDVSTSVIKVLMVEDNVINIMLTKEMLKKIGYDYDVAENGQESIEKLKQNRYDVILMDLQMPIMGGCEATKIIRKELDANIPIIALTAASLPQDKENAFSSGMNDYILKPISFNELQETIERWVYR